MRRNCQKGETLPESLVSILILTLASVLLLTSVSAAARINRAAEEADNGVFRQLMETELAREGQGIPGTVTVTVNGNVDLLPVEVYGGEGFIAWYGEDTP